MKSYYLPSLVISSALLVAACGSANRPSADGEKVGAVACKSLQLVSKMNNNPTDTAVLAESASLAAESMKMAEIEKRYKEMPSNGKEQQEFMRGYAEGMESCK